jgi:light-regulated signal transduction histidine kinase (bacteriophytochrome)
LKEYSQRLQRSNEELEQFAYVASHDLQEPLRKVMTFGDRLKSKYSDSLGENGRDYLERMQGAAARMQTLISDLLAFSRVMTKAQPFVPVDLDEVARDVVSDLEVRIEQTGARIEVSGLEVIDADPLQMRQLMQNLIGNSLKFIKKDGPPVIKVSGMFPGGNGKTHDGRFTDDELYQITVEDNGIGFDEKYADRIFGVFQRLHGRSEYEGTGIGLSICKKIVARHNGNIAARSAPGKGARFVVALPARQKEGMTGRE